MAAARAPRTDTAPLRFRGNVRLRCGSVLILILDLYSPTRPSRACVSHVAHARACYTTASARVAYLSLGQGKTLHRVRNRRSDRTYKKEVIVTAADHNNRLPELRTSSILPHLYSAQAGLNLNSLGKYTWPALLQTLLGPKENN